jgi:ParB family chromosome partitioning protein
VVPEGALYRLIAGYRRFAALKICGKSNADVTILDAAPAEIAAVRLTENIQRADLNPTEEAIALRKLRDEHGLNATALADRLGKSMQWVRVRLQMLTWPDDILGRIARDELALAVAEHLAAIGDPLERARLTSYAIESGASSRVVMGWRAAYETSQAMLTQEQLDAQPAPLNHQPVQILMPCWSCTEPAPPERLHIARLCPRCAIDLRQAIDAGNANS